MGMKRTGSVVEQKVLLAMYDIDKDNPTLDWHAVDIAEDAVETMFSRNQEDVKSSRGKRRKMLMDRVFELECPPGKLGFRIEKPNWVLPDYRRGGTGVAAAGSFIICFGGLSPNGKVSGESRYLQDFHYLDTTKVSNPEWKKLKMLYPRASPLMAAMDGKIYIFRGIDGNIRRVLPGEVFDSHTPQQLSPLPVLPEIIPEEILDDLHIIAAVDVPKRKRIMLFSLHSDNVLSYNIQDSSWNLSQDPFFASGLKENERFPLDVLPLVVGETMYWFSRTSSVHAYDIVRHKWHSSAWIDLQKHGQLVPNKHYKTLLHLSGEFFCLVWVDHYAVQGRYRQIRCTKLKISKKKNVRRGSKESLSVSVVSTHTYLAPPPFLVVKAFLLNTSKQG